MSTKAKNSDSERRQFWQMVMETRKESGLSIAAFCKKEGISEPAYYYWRRKLTGGVSKSQAKSAPNFLEVVVPSNDSMALELVLASGNTLRINHGTDNQMLGQVLLALRQAGLC